LQNRKAVCLLLLILTVVSFCASQQAAVFAAPLQDDIDIEVEGGYGGIAKLGAWSRLFIRVCSTNRNISGEIEVEAYLDQSRKVVVSKPVELIAGIEQEIAIEIPVVTAHRGIDIRLVEKKKVRYQTEYNFKRLLSPDIMMIGVLSEDKDAFNWLNGYTVSLAIDKDVAEKVKSFFSSDLATAQQMQQYKLPLYDEYFEKHEAVVIQLDRDSFPDMQEIMENFDFLIISRYDTSLLDKTQLSVLEEWVETGGLLVTTTGISWQKVYRGLPESLKPFSVTRVEDAITEDILEKFTGRDAAGINLKLAKGNHGLKYIDYSEDYTDPGNQNIFSDDYIIVGEHDNPIAIHYRKGTGSVIVLTFDPTVEPFASWHHKTAFMESVFKYTDTGIEDRFYDYGNGFYRRYANSGGTYIQDIATDVPYDSMPPYGLMFIILGIYVILAGPVLYLVLKRKDRRDLAWVLIPALSVVFLAGMYIFGFKTRLNSAIVNTVSLIETESGSDKAYVSSVMGAFNNRRGTITIEYDSGNGIYSPFIERENYYRYYRGTADNQIAAKYTVGDRVKYEQYNVALWTPKTLYAQKTIPFDGNILKNIQVKDGSIKGVIENTTPYDLLDAVLVIGNSIVRIGDIVAWDSVTLDIPLDSKDVFKRPDDYLEKLYGKTYYPNRRDYPPNFMELRQKRRLVEDYLDKTCSSSLGRPTFTLIAMNEQELSYDLTVNSKKPKTYNKNLVAVKSSLNFVKGQETEIPPGVITSSKYQGQDVAINDKEAGLGILNTGDLLFEYVLPDNIIVDEMRFTVGRYIPPDIKRYLEENPSVRLSPNKYRFYLYNVITRAWDEFAFESNRDLVIDVTVKNNMSQYIGSGNEVGVRISVVELGQPVEIEGYYGYYNYNMSIAAPSSYYYSERITMPDIYIKGVSK